jgi:hypothetical protein
MSVTLSQPWTPGSGVLELRVWWRLCDSSLASRLQSIKSSFSYLVSGLDIHSLNSVTEGPPWLGVLGQHIAPPVAFLLKQVIEEGMTDMFTCDTRAFRIWFFQRDLSEKPFSGLSPREGSPLSSDHPPLASRSRGLAVTQDGGVLSALNDEIPATL